MHLSIYLLFLCISTEKNNSKTRKSLRRDRIELPMYTGCIVIFMITLGIGRLRTHMYVHVCVSHTTARRWLHIQMREPYTGPRFQWSVGSTYHLARQHRCITAVECTRAIIVCLSHIYTYYIHTYILVYIRSLSRSGLNQQDIKTLHVPSCNTQDVVVTLQLEKWNSEWNISRGQCVRVLYMNEYRLCFFHDMNDVCFFKCIARPPCSDWF